MIDWQAGAWPRLLMVIVTPLTNQGVCWAFMADCGSDQCFFPTSSGKLVEERISLERSDRSKVTEFLEVPEDSTSGMKW